MPKKRAVARERVPNRRVDMQEAGYALELQWHFRVASGNRLDVRGSTLGLRDRVSERRALLGSSYQYNQTIKLTNYRIT